MRSGWLVLVALLSAPGVVRADETFRCGKWIASSDMSVADLLARCGEPTLRTSSTEEVRVRNQFGLMQKTGETTVMTWTYDRGATAAPMVVIIVDGRIKSIDRQKRT